MKGNPPDPRPVGPQLWVGSVQARRELRPGDFELVVDCLGVDEPCPCPVVVVTPTGRTGHTWSPADLDRITALVAPHLEAGRPVLIHCRRGVSRSATAAAAVLLHLGWASTVEEAIARTRHARRRPAASSQASLKRWFEARSAGG